MLAAFSLGAIVGRTNSALSAELGGGDGLTEETAIEISSAEQLKTFADSVNDGNSYEGQYIKLTANIDLGYSTSYDLEDLYYNPVFDGWDPIGNSGSPFKGSFDGNGFAVSHLYIKRVSYLGLFGHIGVGGEVKNLGIASGFIKGDYWFGGIAGSNRGLIENCYSAAYIFCRDSGSECIGGIAGENRGTIKNCYNTGTVDNTNNGRSGFGGIAGINRNGAIIENCYNTGNIKARASVGGIAGENYGGTIKNCYSTGTVQANESPAGGVAGSNSGSIENCYYNVDNYNGNAIGDGGLTTGQMLSGELIAGLTSGDGAGEWIKRPNKDGVYYYPELAVFYGSAHSAASAAVTPGNGGGKAAISFGGITVSGNVYGGEPIFAVDCGDYDGDMTFEYKERNASDLTYTAQKPTSAGQYTLRVLFSETAEYFPSWETFDFEITKIDGGGNLEIEGWTYGESANVPTVSGATGIVLSYDYYVDMGGGYTKLDSAPVNAGRYKVVAAIEESENYFGAVLEREFIISKAVPVVLEKPDASEVRRRDRLGSSELSGGKADVDGTFEWTDPEERLSESGSYSVTFVPDDLENYETVVFEVSVSVLAESMMGLGLLIVIVVLGVLVAPAVWFLFLIAAIIKIILVRRKNSKIKKLNAAKAASINRPQAIAPAVLIAPAALTAPIAPVAPTMPVAPTAPVAPSKASNNGFRNDGFDVIITQTSADGLPKNRNVKAYLDRD
ncbi:MAG: hypothetical protein LBQ40_01540 [Clostridiales bacterium]|nr:hypothetical protein [Clostridiales bacterium]